MNQPVSELAAAVRSGDRAALPEVAISRDTDVEYIPPRAGLEESLASIWRGILPVEQIGAGEYQGRVELDEAGAGPNLRIRIRGARDPSNADQRQSPLGQPIHVGE